MTLNFRTYLKLEQLKKQLSEAVESGEFPDRVFSFLSTASARHNPNAPWQNTVFCFLQTVKDTQPDSKLPLIKGVPQGKGKDAPWEYEGRSWAHWSHILARAYGWTLEYIGDLDYNEALARVQEILTEEQLEHEFYYGLSEVAYPYNKSIKKSVYKPLPRPYWMKVNVPPPAKQKFHRSMLPVGLVQDISGMPQELNPLRGHVEIIHQKKTEETEPAPDS